MTDDRVRVTYLYDALCGWCYGAIPAIRRLALSPDVVMSLQPTGLFAGANARTFDDSFAAYIRSADQHVEQISGQPFTDLYRKQVMGAARRVLDSGPATLAITAVVRSAPERELDALAAVQTARWSEGRDITAPAVLADVLRGLGLADAAAAFEAAGDDLTRAAAARVAAGEAMMRAIGVSGLPALAVSTADGPRRARAEMLFDTPHDLLVERLRAT